MHSVYGRMRTLAHVDTAVKEAHIENINKKFNKSENEISKKVHNDMNTMDVEEDNFEVCPWCGGKLLLRVAKKGVHAGSSFYGCSNYPKCKYVRNSGD